MKPVTLLSLFSSFNVLVLNELDFKINESGKETKGYLFTYFRKNIFFFFVTLQSDVNKIDYFIVCHDIP